MTALPDTFPTPNLVALAHALGPLVSIFDIRWVENCESTNSTLLEAPPDENGKTHVLVATRQNAGRGRRGRRWLSWPGASLTFSVLWRFVPGTPAPAGLSLAVGLALARTLEKLGMSAVALKWPNDVLAHGAKLAGVLVELLPSGHGGAAAVIGIGMNLSLPEDADIPDRERLDVTDLTSEMGDPPPLEELLAAILHELYRTFSTYSFAGFSLLRNAWQHRNAFANLPVRVSGEGADIVGLCLGVDEDGALLVRDDGGGGVRRVLAGEVSLRPAP
ncbi:MAG: biotin--[acetyl-CoA-carboxylase] ligase [Azoarcus sp.]|jgi:BirA family biotin operon repressor/biotin-[acetyl-CoA-carboxylase] ligase|nr:biotin--[acetyl-CoA-carboxylase] ligase [Azoarcus sp.]